MVKKILTIALTMTLVACADGRVTEKHIKGATELCLQNGGIEHITNADTYAEFKSCGHKCSRRTGNIVAEAGVVCRNGAIFSMKYSYPEQ